MSKTSLEIPLSSAVIAGVNSGVRGIDGVWQPGPAANGLAKDRIGVLYDFKQIMIGGHIPNDVDAAIAKLDSPSDVIPGVRQIGAISGTAPGVYRSSTKKFGWKTRLTNGKLRYRLSFIMSYSSGDALFEDQYGIVGDTTNFANHGDSGAIVLDDRSRAIGLLFSVAAGMNLAVANPIDRVLTYFSVEPA